MPDQETKELRDLLTQVRLDIATMSGKLDRINDMDKELKDVEQKSTEALQSTKAAHKRLDKMDDAQTWLWRTVVGAMIVGVLNLILRFYSGGGQ